MTMEMSPNKSRRSTIGKKSIQGQYSPHRDSVNSKMMSAVGNTSRMTSGPSPARSLDMHKRTGIELRESPSKSARIMMKYINSYPDVGPINHNAQGGVSYKDLQEMAQQLDKKELGWVRSDMRLIFALDDTQIVDEGIEKLNKILNNE